MKTVLLVLLALVVCAIFGTAFLAALGKFFFDVFMKVFGFGFALSGCLIRLGALILGFLLLCMLAKGA